MSAYAQPSGGGGSAYAQTNSSGGSVYAGGSGGPAPHKSGGILHSVEAGLTDVAKGVEGIGTGTYKLGKDAYNNLAAPVPGGWHGLLQEYEHPFRPVPGDPLAADVQGMVKGSYQPLEHPLRDPFQTALSVATLASLGAGGAARLAYAADAARAGDAASAAKALASPLHKPPTALRFVDNPKAVLQDLPAGVEGPRAVKIEPGPVQLHASGSPLVRAFQAGHDKLIQGALDNGTDSLLAKYAQGRIAGSVGEGTRITSNLRAVPVKLLERAGGKFDKGVSRAMGQLALFLRSANVTAPEAADFWSGKTGKIKPTRATLKLAAVAQKIADQGLLHVGGDGNVAVHPDYPGLAKASDLMGAAQAGREDIIQQHQLMTDAGLATRKNLVGNTMVLGFEGDRQGLGYTPLKTSEKRAPQNPIAAGRSPVIPAAKKLSVGKEATGGGVVSGRIPDNTTGGVARALHDALRYTNTVEFRSRAAALGSDVKRTASDVLIRDPAAKVESTIPESIDVLLKRKRSTVDTIPEEEHAGLARAMQARLHEAIPGLEDSFARDRAAGIGVAAPAGFKWVPRRMIPQEIVKTSSARNGLEKFADSLNSAVTAATVYLKLGHLPTRLFTNAATNVMQGSAPAIAAQAVAHITSTFGKPIEIGKSAKLVGALTEEEKQELAAITGTHGYQALPHEGASRAAVIAGKGAGWWAHHIDAPFRINSVLYEFRQIGITTPEQVRAALAQLKDPARHGMDAVSASKLDWAVRRANRAAIMYDGLNDFEKRYLTRLFWFYPWTKGATRFAFHTAAEHPVKALAVGQTGELGARYQQQQLGAAPSYEFGLTPLTGGANPLTNNISSFNPFSTVGQDADVVAHPLRQDSGVFGQLNPAYSALAALVRGKGLMSAAGTALQPTPEAQIVTGALSPPGANRMFGTTDVGYHGDPRIEAALSALARALGGTAVPRPTRVPVLNKAAAHENARKRTITVYGP